MKKSNQKRVLNSLFTCAAAILIIAGNLAQANAQDKNNVVQSGKMLPTTKNVDCTRMYCFNNGITIVEKGQSKALIDTAGNFIIPYNKYAMLTYCGVGLIMASADHVSLVLNSKGQVIADLEALRKTLYDTKEQGNYVFLSPQSNRHNITLINAEGKKYTITESPLPGGKFLELQKISEGAIIMRNPVTDKVGFKNLANQLVAEPAFDNLQDFLDGFSVFTMQDQFGQTRFGIIDINGKKPLPGSFINEPGNLGSGYFFLRAANDSEMDYVIMGQNGQVVYKQLKNTPVRHYFNYYEDGYFYSSDNFILDTKGNVLSALDFLAKNGLKLMRDNFPAFVQYKKQDYLSFSSLAHARKDGFLLFEFTLDKGRTYQSGFYNVKTNKILLGAFARAYEPNYEFSFDPASNRALVTQKSDKKDVGGNFLENIGFINADGNFVILKTAQKSDF